MAKRCSKHKNFTVTETAREHIAHTFEDGQYRFSDHVTGSELATVEVSCKDCGLIQHYSKCNMPRWLKEACKAAGIVL